MASVHAVLARRGICQGRWIAHDSTVVASEVQAGQVSRAVEKVATRFICGSGRWHLLIQDAPMTLRCTSTGRAVSQFNAKGRYRTQKRPAGKGGALRVLVADAYWITRRWVKVCSPAVRFTR